MPEQLIGVEAREDGVCVLRLQRERKLNALSSELERQLAEALRSDAVRSSSVVVVTGGERAFSAGADVSEFRERGPEQVLAYYRETGGVYETFSQLPQPTIAAISGYCLGGGLELALAADFRVADPSAQFGFPEIGIGILPSSGGVARLVRDVGPARARDLVLRGRRFTPDLAERWGLITEVAAPGEHLAHALAIATEVAAAPPLAVQLTTQVIDAAAESSHRTALLLEQLAYSALNRTN